MDYLCAKFGNFSFSRFGFIVRTESHTEADDRHTHVTTVGMSNHALESTLVPIVVGGIISQVARLQLRIKTVSTA